MRIEVSLHPSERVITIYDNGVGIACDRAESILISIGNSPKSADYSRGFRGIGRLSALSYCKSLLFETSKHGETLGTRLPFDAARLNRLLLNENRDDLTAEDVLRDIYSVEVFSEQKQNHYFRVTMNDVDDASGLNDFENVLTYLSQNVPVPYDSSAFAWGKEICRRLQKEGHYIQQYPVILIYGGKTVPIYKPYCDRFLVDKSKLLFDEIKDVDIVRITKSNGDMSAIGWIAKTNYLGSIYDKRIKGLRLRKGNILIGDSQTLNTTFKDARFNGWTIGEIYAIDTRLIPNARRDNFEKNSACFLLLEHLTTIASQISKEVRSASVKRNYELANALEQSDSASEAAKMALTEGLTANQKVAIRQELTKAQYSVSNLTPGNDTDAFY